MDTRITNPFERHIVELNNLEISILLQVMQHNLPKPEEEIVIMGLYAKLKRKQEETADEP